MIFRLLVLYLINDNSSLANSISKCKVMRSSFFVLLKLSADTIWGHFTISLSILCIWLYM